MTEDIADKTVDILTRLDIDTVAPSFSAGLGRLDAAATRDLDAAGIPAPLRELIRIRASQLNGCAYCVNMHTKDSLAGGDTVARVAAVSVWRESPFFTQRERAALALTETITRAADTHVPQSEWNEAASVFGPAELGAVVALIVVINAWNAVGVSTRAWTPEA